MTRWSRFSDPPRNLDERLDCGDRLRGIVDEMIDFLSRETEEAQWDPGYAVLRDYLRQLGREGDFTLVPTRLIEDFKRAADEYDEAHHVDKW